MSNKRWAGGSKDQTLEFDKPPPTVAEVDEDDGVNAFSEQLHSHKPKQTDRDYPSPFNKGLDNSVWLLWEEMEGDTDGSGELAMCAGTLDPERTRIHPLGKFMSEPLEGPVMTKLADAPVWATAIGQNVGPSLSGHCQWEVSVIRRDGNMYIGVVLPHGVSGELDRRWDTKCWQGQAFFWATTAGSLMNGPAILKTLPTNKVPVCHFNNGDVVTLDLKVNAAEYTAVVVSVDDSNLYLTNLRTVKLRIERGDRREGDVLENLPPIYLDNKVYAPAEFDSLAESFTIALREPASLRVGDRCPFRLTASLAILWHDIQVGRIEGVPPDAAPAVCLSSKGDMVSLRPVWSKRDQKIIDQTRASLAELLGDMGVKLLMEFAADSTDGLRDWVILKALRVCKYVTDNALQDLAEYCESNAAESKARKERNLRILRQKMALSAYHEDTTVSDRFCMTDMSKEANKWAPETLQEALKWRPGGRHHDHQEDKAS